MPSDLRYAIRSLLRTPGFTLVAVLTLALGIGANTALFSVLRAVLLQPLPYAQPERLTYVWMDNPGTQLADDVTSWPMFLHWQKHGTSFASMAVYGTTTAFNFTGEGEPERLSGTLAGPGFLETLGVQPALGRGFTDAEQVPGADLVVILGHNFWQRRFAGDPGVLGRQITINGRPRTIVGVMPAGFFFYEQDDVLVPLAAPPEAMANARSYHLPVIGRLKPGITLAQAQAELAAAQESFWTAVPESRGYGVKLAAMHGWQVREVRTALWVLLGAVGCVLLITCANLANLLLARGLARRREIAVRLAIGASRAAVARQLLVESLLLAGCGGLLGLLLGTWGLQAVKVLAASYLPRAHLIQTDAVVLGVSLGAALLCGLGFGLLPAWQAGQADPQTALRDGGRGASASRATLRARAALIVVQTAVAVVLLVSAGLLFRSFLKLSAVDTGLKGADLTFIPVALPQAAYDSPAKVAAFQHQAIEKLAAVPGVQSAGLASFIVINRLHSSTIFTLERQVWNPGEPRPELTTDIISPTYFETMGIPLVEGRPFAASDNFDGPRVVLINEKVARTYWPGRSAVGQRILFGNLPPPDARDPQGRPVTPNWLTIVGVVRDLRRQGPDQPVRLEAYLPSTQFPRPNFRFVVRSALPAAALAPALRAAVWSIDRNLPLPIIDPVAKTLSAATAQRRLNLGLIGSFAGLALTLAALGLYGVIAWSVSQRTGEFGVRLALGAPPGSLQRLVLGQSAWLVGCGLAAGVAGSLALSRLVESMLFNVPRFDVATYGGVCLLLGAASFLAAWLPAHRAAQVDPLVSLRAE